MVAMAVTSPRNAPPVRGAWADSAGGGAGKGWLGFLGTLRPANAAVICILAGLALSLLGVYAIDIGAGQHGAQAGGGGEGASQRSTPLFGLHGVALKQLLFLGVGCLAAVVTVTPHYRLFGRASWALLAGVVGLLVFLLVPAVPSWLVTPRNGTRGWINLGVVDLQPAELAKIAFVLVVAWHMRYRSTHRRLAGLLPLGAIAAAPIALITLQPDLGSALLFVPALFAMLVAAGAKLKHLSLIVLLAVLAVPASYPILRPHQQARIVGLVKQFQGDRSLDQEINMQAVTAQRMIASGGVLGNSEPAARAILHFNRLPERHNDMVFAVIVHRFGLLGGVATLLLYLIWVGGALLAAASTRDPFGRLVVVGLAAFVAAQAVINVGMNVGLLPIIGVTLPFVSYGGSSLVTVWAMNGLIFNVAVRRPRPPYRQSFEYADDDDQA